MSADRATLGGGAVGRNQSLKHGSFLGGQHLEIPAFLQAIERSGVSTWIRETDSIFGFYFLLTIHTLGLALVVGPSAIINARLLGVARELPLAALKRWFVLMWPALGATIVSGVVLAFGYPVMALTNPIFALKMILLGFAVWTLRTMQTQVFGSPVVDEAGISAIGRSLAIKLMVLWIGVIAGGRLLAYSCNYLMAGVPCS